MTEPELPPADIPPDSDFEEFTLTDETDGADQLDQSDTSLSRGDEPGEGTLADEDPTAVGAAHDQAPTVRTVYRGSGVRWGFVAGLVLAILLVILVFQNTDPVRFKFLVWEIETPLAALLLATAVVAAVADELVGLVVRSSRRRRLKEREELKALRSITPE